MVDERFNNEVLEAIQDHLKITLSKEEQGTQTALVARLVWQSSKMVTVISEASLVLT